jgi:carbon monoxide dehydrogenase subunit G
LAAVGTRLVGGVAKKMAGQFFDSVDKQAQNYK